MAAALTFGRTRRATLTVAALAAVALLPVQALPAAPAVPAASPFDGDAATTERLLEFDAIRVAVDGSQQRFAATVSAGRHAIHAVLSRSDVFADALAGSALTAEGPMLFTPSEDLASETSSELARLLPRGATVYLLGGPAALSAEVEADVRALGLTPVRLFGETRIETAIAIADVVRDRNGAGPVLLARSRGVASNESSSWADSVSGGAYAAQAGIPVLVTPTDELHPAVKAWLDRDRPTVTYLLGGQAALTSSVFAAVPRPQRVSGADRTETATEIARRLWQSPTSGARRYVMVNADGTDGWAFGFVAAGLAADAGVPVLLVRSSVSDAVRRAVSSCGEPEVDLLVVGDGTVVHGSIREQLDAFDGRACGPSGAIVARRASLASFEGCTPFLAHMRELALERVGPYGLNGFGHAYIDTIALPGEVRAEGTTAPTASEDAGASPLPATGSTDSNVQVAGVDEPDIVKVTGTTAAITSDGDVVIVELTTSPPTILARIDDVGHGATLLLDDTRLLVLTNRWRADYRRGAPEPALTDYAGYGGTQTSTLALYDVANPSAPQLVRKTEVDGSLISARMVDGVARVVVQSQPHDLPFVYPEDGSRASLQAAADRNRDVITEATPANWLPTYRVISPSGSQLSTGSIDCADVGRPERFSGMSVVGIITLDLSGSGSPSHTAGVLGSAGITYASADTLIVATSRWGSWEPILPGGFDPVSTELHTFDISDPVTSAYAASGRVAGYLYSQFALSEQAGLVRVASTTEPPWQPDIDRAQSDSRVSILQANGSALEVIGEVDGLGKGERIHSVRFMGDIAAVVTFRQVDPLYLIDLSVPSAPKVTGELKVTGFSSYLHLARDGVLIGVGQEADETGRTTGPQVSTFDISDLTAPSLIDRVTYPQGYTIEGTGHLGFRYLPSGRMLMPLTTYENYPSSGLAIDLDATGNLTEAGRFRAVDSNNQDVALLRTLVIGDTIYAIGQRVLSTHSMTSFANTGQISLQ